MLPLMCHMSPIVFKPVFTLCRCQGEVCITVGKDFSLNIIKNIKDNTNMLVQITPLRLLHC